MASLYTLYLVLSRDPVRYTILSGQSVLVPNMYYQLIIGFPTGNSPGETSTGLTLYLSSEDGTTIAQSSLLTPSVSDPHGTFQGTLVIDSDAVSSYFTDEDDETMRADIVIKDNQSVFLTSEITITRPPAEVNTVSTMTWDTAMLSAIRFDTLADFKAWLAGDKTRTDGVTPASLLYGAVVHTQCEGSYMLTTEISGNTGSLTKHFTRITMPDPVKGYYRITSNNGDGGFAVHGRDVYDDSWAASYTLDGITSATPDATYTYTFDKYSTGIVTFADLDRALRGLSVGSDGATTAEVAARLTALENEVAALKASGGGTSYRAGDGITISNGVISLEHDIAEAVSALGAITDSSTVGDVADVTQVILAASK